ncbi:COG4223 family protein [Phenylobacterium sp. VNQ135]|uniref:COG4223 family protein n=1 Tax=Phenylobacterium sp. VNQ135 TaxID=3400922 RepID=UPI003BFC1D6A
MTQHPESALPKDPAAYRRAPFGLGLWSLMALCLLCVLAGAGVAAFLPRFLPTPATVPHPAEPVQAVPAVAPAAPPPPAESADAAEIRRLNARISVLETEGARTSEAAASALAAAALLEATQSSAPFTREIAALRAAAPDLPELAALGRAAAEGAPSRAALAAEFPAYAAQAASAARTPDPDAKLADRLIYGLSRVVSVRRTSDVRGASPDALLARAELALNEGDVAGALKILEALPAPARESLAPWRAKAERRAEIDRHAARLRARAVRDLQAAGVAPAAVGGAA